MPTYEMVPVLNTPGGGSDGLSAFSLRPWAVADADDSEAVARANSTERPKGDMAARLPAWKRAGTRQSVWVCGQRRQEDPT